MSPNVFPVIDYEPPSFGGPPVLPPVHPAKRSAVHDQPPPHPVDDPRIRVAATFADAVLRRVLEVIDRRRPMSQLRPLLAPGLVDSLLSVRVPDAGMPGRLRRVLAQPIGDHAAEVAANYSRGQQVHAIACRIEQISTPTGPRWQVVALHMG